MTSGQGFLIKCGEDEEEVIVTAEIVTAEQFEKMGQNCDYFRNVFAHGTRESRDRILNKPDWSSATTKCIIELASTGATVGGVSSYLQLVDAAPQILLELDDNAAKCWLPSVVEKSSVHRGENFDESLLELCSEIETKKRCLKSTFETGKTIGFDSWVNLSSRDIVVADEVTKINVKLKRKVLNGIKSSFGHILADLFCEDWTVGVFDGFKPRMCHVYSATQPSAANVMHRVSMIHEKHRSDGKVFTTEEFSLRVFGVQTIQKIQSESTARCYSSMLNSRLLS
jgi:hypothetical protein